MMRNSLYSTPSRFSTIASACLLVNALSLAASSYGQTIINGGFETAVVHTVDANWGPYYTPPVGDSRNRVETTGVEGWTFSASGGGGGSPVTGAGIISAFHGASFTPNIHGVGLSPSTDPAAGANAAFVEQLGWLQTEVVFSAAGDFTLNFIASSREYSTFEPLPLRITLNGQAFTFNSLEVVTPQLGVWSAFASDSMHIEAGTYTLRIEGALDMGYATGIDNISFQAVPEPSSVALLLGGVGVALCAIRRKRQSS